MQIKIIFLIPLQKKRNKSCEIYAYLYIFRINNRLFNIRFDNQGQHCGGESFLSIFNVCLYK